MFINVACSLRSIVAIVSVGNLKEYLKDAIAVLPPESSLKPIIIKEILDNKNLQKEDLKKTLQKLKEIVKEYDQPSRDPFQKTILQPIQAFFSPAVFIPTEMRNVIREQKKILQKSEEELSKAQRLIQKNKPLLQIVQANR